MARRFGAELVSSLNDEVKTLRASIEDRYDRIFNGQTDMDDCFLSDKCESRAISLALEKINLIEKDNGCSWFIEYATLDGTLVKANWCNTKYGTSLRVVMPDDSVVWVSYSQNFDKSLAKKGLKRVECLRPAWFAFHSSGSGLLGVYSGSYDLFPSNFNYATGEEASDEPIAIRDIEG